MWVHQTIPYVSAKDFAHKFFQKTTYFPSAVNPGRLERINKKKIKETEEK